ncbi:hypothetical protein W97_01247 [Coniosporium apollinis CBS 100218]|uniref:Zn(2)-C6 fungal-type domain-containing protein n=1 Tax=Coniosporium apollinis (strain CBS 100218) TaxID=1168221 RepID=R7YJH6_CONA1|nr:uncharacterized protein W97_01247 [Coniosporium apollinis CBS 100218]EON62028.1 hypothetical protein W97_01247 [Coniosporium apollinis CBS 100218]
MTPTPPSATSSSTGQSPDAQFRVVRKRNRVPLSCAPCRHRKLKCDRGHPCDNCTKRGDASSCSYASPGNRKKSQVSQSSSSSPGDMQNRIDRLENLVLSLMTNGAQSAGPTAAATAVAGSLSGSSVGVPLDVDGDDMISEENEGLDGEVDKVTKSIGVMKVMDNKAPIFASEAHWYAILGEITEVKNYFSDHKKQYDDQLRRYQAAHPDDDRPGTAFLFGANAKPDQAEVLAAFPQKQIADRLITRYFITYDPALHIIHGPTFQKQYDKHWLNPNETPIIWIGMAFAMMCIALQSYHRAHDEPPEYHGKSWELSGEYRRLTAQCLILADVTQPIPHLLETLLLHLYAEYSRSWDAETGVLLSVGIIVRLAQRMGCHRDSKHYPNISAFTGEMRRRVWTAIRQADLLFSQQAGLPPMIRSTDTNADFPANLYDDELFEEMKELPPSRPVTEATPASYMIAKARLVYMLGRIVDEAQTLSCSHYDEILKLDQQLREVQAALPLHLKMRSMQESSRDDASLIMQRYNLDLLFLRSQCVLHRKFLPQGRYNLRPSYSRRTCIEACMTMLQHQSTLRNESQPGGRLRSVKWFISSLTVHDFLLAAMTVCLELYHSAEAERTHRSVPPEILAWTQDRRDSMVAAIETSVVIWEDLRDHSMEAYKAHATLSYMLSRLKTHQQHQQAQQKFGTAFPRNGMAEDPDVAPEHSAAMTLGMLSTGALNPHTPSMYDMKPPYSNFTPDVSQPLQSTGLTSQYSDTLGTGEQSGVTSTASPYFSTLFGPNLGFQSMDLPSANLDWEVWDSYIQGTANDPTNQMWDLPSNVPDGQINSFGQPQPQMSQPVQQQQQSPMNLPWANAGGVFMGVGTPPRNSMM